MNAKTCDSLRAVEPRFAVKKKKKGNSPCRAPLANDEWFGGVDIDGDSRRDTRRGMTGFAREMRPEPRAVGDPTQFGTSVYKSLSCQ